MLDRTEASGLGVAQMIRSRGFKLVGTLAVLLGAAGVGACGSSQHVDSVPPVISDVFATLGSASPVPVALSSADARPVVHSATPLTLQVEASDDETATDKLKVQALDANLKPIAGQIAVFHNGLWDVTTTAVPGLTVQVAVSDQAGNRVVWPYAAIFLTTKQALVRTWTLLVYDSSGAVTARPQLTLTASTWCQEDDGAGSGPAGGTWSLLSDGRLQMQTRGHLPCSTPNLGNDGSSVESSRTADLYVDATSFSDRPYKKTNGSASSNADLVGTWTRSAEIATSGPAQTVTSSLTLNADNTFQQNTEDGHQIAGTYQQEPSSYSANFGRLLLLTTNQVDGTSVTPTTSVHYWKVSGGELLVDPFVEIH